MNVDRKILDFEDGVMACTRQMDRLYARYAKACGLTAMSLFVLDCICDRPDGCTQKEICEETFFPKQSVNLIVKGFMEQGYVQLTEMPSDRRNKRITLTPAGKDWAEKTVIRYWEAEAEALTTFRDEELETVLRVIRGVSESMTQNVEHLLQQMASQTGAPPADVYESGKEQPYEGEKYCFSQEADGAAGAQGAVPADIGAGSD